MPTDIILFSQCYALVVDHVAVTYSADGLVTVIPQPYVLPAATSSVLGGVKPDGTTITNVGGVISAPAVPATASVLGDVMPDGTTITNTAGAIKVTYGTAANTAAQGNDSRITGAAPTVSPTFTGTPAAPTASSAAGLGSTQLATTAYVRTGTITNDNAVTGEVGEYILQTVPIGSAVALTTAVPTNITSISLTAGDWDVSGLVQMAPAGSTITVSVRGTINTTSASMGQIFASDYPAAVAAAVINLTVPTIRLSLATTTTVYLVTNAQFTTSTLAGYGFIAARRIR